MASTSPRRRSAPRRSSRSTRRYGTRSGVSPRGGSYRPTYGKSSTPRTPSYWPMNPANDAAPSNNPRNWISPNRSVAPSAWSLPKGAGLMLRGASRALPWMGLAFTAWELYELWNNMSPASKKDPGASPLPAGWSESCTGSCGNRSAAYQQYTAQINYTGSAVTPYCGYADSCLSNQAPPLGTSYNDSGFDVAQTTFQFTIPAGAKYFTYGFLGGRWFFGNRRLQFWEAWVGSGPTTSSPTDVTFRTVGQSTPRAEPRKWRTPNWDQDTQVPDVSPYPFEAPQGPSVKPRPDPHLPASNPTPEVIPTTAPWRSRPGLPAPNPVYLPRPLVPYLPRVSPWGEPLRGPEVEPKQRARPRFRPSRSPSDRFSPDYKPSEVPSRQVQWDVKPRVTGQEGDRGGKPKADEKPHAKRRRKKDKEIKAKINASKGLAAVRWALNLVSESCDVVEAAYDALPFKVLRRFERKLARYGSYDNWKEYLRNQGYTEYEIENSGAARFEYARKGYARKAREAFRKEFDGTEYGNKHLSDPNFLLDLGQEGEWGLPCHSKAAILAKHWDDVNVQEFLKNLVVNQVVDGFGGRLGRDMAKTGRRLGMAVGLGTGPVF